MTPPIRPEIHVAVEFPKDPKDMTLREAVDWYKGLVDLNIGGITPLESSYVNERWTTLVEGIASREGVPSGYLSYTMYELASTELRLRATALIEAEEGLLK